VEFHNQNNLEKTYEYLNYKLLNSLKIFTLKIYLKNNNKLNLILI